MDSWNDDYPRDAMRRSAEMLANFSNQLKMRLTPHDHNMTPDDVLFLLNQITSLADSMSNVCEVTKQHEMSKPSGFRQASSTLAPDKAAYQRYR